MRLFLAVDLDAVLRRHLADLLRRAGHAAGDRSRLTWVPPERAHVTLHFLGAVDPEAASRLASIMEAPYRTSPFDMAFGGIQTFPGHGRPRVVWLGVTRGADRVAALAEEAGARLVQAGHGIEARPFVAHLTLARVRGPLAAAARRRLETLDRRELGGTRVDRVTLYESRPGPEGPKYVALASGPLQGVPS